MSKMLILLGLVIAQSQVAMAFDDLKCLTADGKVTVLISHDPIVNINIFNESKGANPVRSFEDLSIRYQHGILSYRYSTSQDESAYNNAGTKTESFRVDFSPINEEGTGGWVLSYDGHIFAEDKFGYAFNCYVAKYAKLYSDLKRSSVDFADLLYKKDFADFYSKPEESKVLSQAYQDKLNEILKNINESIIAGALDEAKVNNFFKVQQELAIKAHSFDKNAELAKIAAAKAQKEYEEREKARRETEAAELARVMKKYSDQVASLDVNHKIKFNKDSQNPFKTIKFQEVSPGVFISDLITQFQWSRIQAVIEFDQLRMDDYIPDTAEYYRARYTNPSEDIYGEGAYSVLFDNTRISILMKPDMPVTNIDNDEHLRKFLKLINEMWSYNSNDYMVELIRKIMPDYDTNKLVGMNFTILAEDEFKTILQENKISLDCSIGEMVLQYHFDRDLKYVPFYAPSPYKYNACLGLRSDSPAGFRIKVARRSIR